MHVTINRTYINTCNTIHLNQNGIIYSKILCRCIILDQKYILSNKDIMIQVTLNCKQNKFTQESIKVSHKIWLISQDGIKNYIFKIFLRREGV